MLPGYEIKIAQGSDRDGIVEFIHFHWKKNHSLTVSRELLDWQHYDSSVERYNFVLGINKSRKEIDGILGFIPVSQFDRELAPLRDYWLALWKVRNDIAVPGLGVNLFFYFQTAHKPRSIGGVAISQVALPIYHALKFRLGKLDHFYIINPAISNFRLVDGVDQRGIPKSIGRYEVSSEEKKLVQVSCESDFQELEGLQSGYLPTKSAPYYVNRYLRHPIYRYDFYAIVENGRTKGVIVVRKVTYRLASALRIVDFAGHIESLSNLKGAFIDLLENTGAEFIDFYSAGVPESNLLSCGFQRRLSGDSVVIPNYFEPFVKKNIDLDYAVKVPEGVSYRFVKGDGDQDRP